MMSLFKKKKFWVIVGSLLTGIGLLIASQGKEGIDFIIEAIKLIPSLFM